LILSATKHPKNTFGSLFSANPYRENIDYGEFVGQIDKINRLEQRNLRVTSFFLAFFVFFGFFGFSDGLRFFGFFAFLTAPSPYIRFRSSCIFASCSGVLRAVCFVRAICVEKNQNKTKLDLTVNGM